MRSLGKCLLGIIAVGMLVCTASAQNQQSCQDRYNELSVRSYDLISDHSADADRLQLFLDLMADLEGQTECGTLLSGTEESDYDYCDGKRGDWSGPVNSWFYAVEAMGDAEILATGAMAAQSWLAADDHLDDMEEAIDLMESAAAQFPHPYTMTVAEDAAGRVSDWVEENL